MFIKRIRPHSVQFYTLDKEYPSKELKPASKQELNQVKYIAEKAAISTDIF